MGKRLAAAVCLVLWLSACTATPPGALTVVTPSTTLPSDVEALTLAKGTSVVVYLRNGDVAGGRLREIGPDRVVLEPLPTEQAPRIVQEADIDRLGVVVGRSRPARAWIGFAIGAVLSLPLSISMFGDAILVLGGLGMWAGSTTGDSRVELRLVRP